MILTPVEHSYFTIFGCNIQFYSLCILSGILSAFFTAQFCIKKFNLSVSKDIFLDFTPLLIVAAVIGARLYYVFLSMDYFIKNPVSIPMVWQGGISIHGAILAGIIFGIFYFKKKKLKFFNYADLYAFVLPLGQAIGRWGNFFNQEAFGLPVLNNAPVKLFIDSAHRPLKYADYSYFHPVFLYESILDLIIFLILLFLIKKTARKFDGLVFFTYILLYSIVRLPLEYLRLDTVFYFLNIPFPAFISVFGILTGLIGIIWRLRYKH